MAKKPETVFKERVLRDLKTLPLCWFSKIQQVAINGTPDILLCLNGIFIAIELKKDAKSKTSKLQDYNLQKIREAGGLSFVVYPDIWNDVLDDLRQIVEN